MAQSRQLLQSLQEELVPDIHEHRLDEVLAAVMVSAQNARVEKGISLASVTPDRAAGGSQMADIGQMAEVVPGSALKTVKVNMTGTYQTYKEFLEYLVDLKRHPLSIVRLKVEENSFELSIRIYGK